ncbi:unnamed protein product [Cuscuta europaea]|uniref:Uncharacterized protein n=1 Tax=Cuscuta europaea TaxID=41803 RepID=A0A9P1E806_CUSEU|nr:unnamed protein product [Cuscuta europaea]
MASILILLSPAPSSKQSIKAPLSREKLRRTPNLQPMSENVGPAFEPPLHMPHSPSIFRSHLSGISIDFKCPTPLPITTTIASDLGTPQGLSTVHNHNALHLFHCPNVKSGNSDRFVAISRSDSGGFYFAASSNSLLILRDVRKSFVPMLQWGMGPQSPKP